MSTAIALLVALALVICGLVTIGIQRWRAYAVGIVPIATGALIGIYIVVKTVIDVGAEVFSVAGLRWSFGLGPTDDLSYPWPVRLVTWLIVVQLVVVGSAVADRRSGENLGLGLLGVWGFAHLTTARRAGWLVVVGMAALVRRVDRRTQVTTRNEALTSAAYLEVDDDIEGFDEPLQVDKSQPLDAA